MVHTGSGGLLNLTVPGRPAIWLVKPSKRQNPDVRRGAVATLSRDQLVRALLARVQLFTVTLDREAVLAPGALAQAEALMAKVPDPSRGPEAVEAIADLHQCRSMLTGAEATQAATIAAALRRLSAGSGPGASTGNLGNLLHARGDLDAALPLYEAAVERGHSEAKASLGAAHAERGDWARAETLFREAAEGGGLDAVANWLSGPAAEGDAAAQAALGQLRPDRGEESAGPP
jgi:tetratricopeptide (TPR) repeat protein